MELLYQIVAITPPTLEQARGERMFELLVEDVELNAMIPAGEMQVDGEYDIDLNAFTWRYQWTSDQVENRCEEMEWKGQDYGWGDYQECDLPLPCLKHPTRDAFKTEYLGQPTPPITRDDLPDWDVMELITLAKRIRETPGWEDRDGDKMWMSMIDEELARRAGKIRLW